MPGNAARAPLRHEGNARNDPQPDTNQTGQSLSTIAGRTPPQVSVALAVRVTAEANRIDAELRDEGCRCPGRAHVPHAWDLGSHKAGCRAGYAWLSVDDVRAILQRFPRRELDALSAAIGGAG